MNELIRPKKLRKGSRVAIVSLSSGILGEPYSEKPLRLGMELMHDLGMEPVLMSNTLKGVDYLDAHPEARADDLKAAFADRSIDGILCAIGGDDTYRLLPFLMEDEDFKRNVIENPKVFMGYSDTTVNHLMFYRLGLQTFYGPSFLGNFSELGGEILSYTKAAVRTLFEGEELREIVSSPIWYEERADFSAAQIGVPRVSHNEIHGFELLQGDDGFTGELLGGCLESLYDLMTGQRYGNENLIAERYGIFPDKNQWQGKVLFVETSEETPDPEQYTLMLVELKKRGVFESVNGIIVGKPQNEIWYEEYKKALIKVIDAPVLPVLYNINFGHAYPKTILAYGQKVICYRDRIIIC